MTVINAYLSFNGNCQEAMTFYKECLGGELVLQPIEGSPMAEHMPPEARNGIMHACLTSGGMTLMGSDMGGAQTTQGNRVSLMLNCSSEEEIDRFFASLSVGGEVDQPLADVFWGSKFGQFTDKFGISWMLHFERNVPVS